MDGLAGGARRRLGGALERAQTTDGRLLRLLGIGFGVAVSVGGTVGVGILRAPGLVASHLPDPWLLTAAWLLGGAYAVLGTLCVIELGAALPSAGGWYVYARRAFGAAGGFAVGWADWLTQSASVAYLVVSVGDFSAALFPAIAGGRTTIAAGTIALFAGVQWLGLRSSSLVQQASSLVKGAAFGAFVAVCLLHGAAAPAAVTPRPALGIVAVVLALQAVIVTYDGWYTPIYFTEEDRDPGRNLPRAALGGVACSIAIYVLVNVGLLAVLGVDGLAAASLPLAAAAHAIFGGSGARIVTALALVSLIGVIGAVLLAATRILFAVARDGAFAPLLASVNAAGTPVPAMLATAGTAALIVLTGTFEQIIAVVAVMAVAVYVSGFVALLVLRRREPDLPRPFRVPGYPWVPLVGLAVSLAFLVAAVMGDPRSSLLAGVLLAVSYPVYRLLSRRKVGDPVTVPS